MVVALGKPVAKVGKLGFLFFKVKKVLGIVIIPERVTGPGIEKAQVGRQHEQLSKSLSCQSRAEVQG